MVVLILSYVIDNSPYSFVGGATLGQRIEQIKAYLGVSADVVPEDVVVVNISYDRALVTVLDEFGFPKGNIDITDRSKLLRFLQKAKRSNYKYLMLDVTFVKGHKTDVDSILFNEISKMNNIVVAKSENFVLADDILSPKARYSDYSTHIAETNFVKYDYFRNGELTFPAKVYYDLSSKRLHKFGPFYFFNGRLARKSVVLKLPIKLWNEYAAYEMPDSKSFRFRYYNLGSDILESGMDVAKLIENKIVVIGDVCENDMHDTYLGKIAGPIINLNAFYALVNDDLSIPYLEIVGLFVIYFAISFILIKRFSVINFIPFLKKHKSKTFRFLLSFVSLSLLFTVVGLSGYLLFGVEINILVPSLYFTIFGYAVNYYFIIKEK